MLEHGVLRGGALVVGTALLAGAVVETTPLRAQVVERWQAERTDTAAGPPVALSLEEAVRRAIEESEEVQLARARVRVADAQVTATRAQALPQLSGSLGYTRTFASPFGGGGIPEPDGPGFDPDPEAPLEERVTYLEENVGLAALAGLSEGFGDLPFGQENTYVAQIRGSQLLYSGGQVSAALDIARRVRRASRLNLAEDVSEIELQVRSAYYRALLALELEAISEAALAQAEDFLAQERLRLESGRASELEVLRAQVSRDNLRPQLVEARNAAELATLDLKRLVDVPLARPVDLTTPLEPPPADSLEDVGLRPELLSSRRAAVEAAREQVAIREDQVAVARGAFLPNVSVSMAYGQQLLPQSPFDFGGDWRTDWTANLSVQVPIFNGGRRFAEMDQARIQLDQAEIQLAQLEEAVQLQLTQALGEKRRARAAIDARETTVEAAQRVHDLTVLQYEQGRATQLEVSQARLELLQARTNLAQAIADYHIADAGVTRAQADAAAGASTTIPPVPPQPDSTDPGR